MKVVDAEGMARIDARAQSDYHIPSMVLMENAGLRGWLLARDRLWSGGIPSGQIAFLAGRGKNGGDAMVMARHALIDRARPVVVLAGGRPNPGTDPAANLACCEGLGIPLLQWPEQRREVQELLSGAGPVIDGIAGTGLRGALRKPLDELVALANQSPCQRIAIDVPSGLGDGYREGWPVFEAHATLTMGLPKSCLFLPRARQRCGRILIVQVGFPPALLEDSALPWELLDESGWSRFLPAIRQDAHKGDRGYLAVFAGSPGTTGAAWLASHAAARARVGLVALYLDPLTWPTLASRCVSVMAKPWNDSMDPTPATGNRAASGGLDPSRWTALLVGPGWGVSDSRLRWLEWLHSLGLPGVLDADGLALLSRSRIGQLEGRWVLTPHPGEFSRLTGVPREEVLDDPLSQSMGLARERQAVVVLKGHVTIVAEPGGKAWILDGGNPALATGGTGDVLAGLVAAGLAFGLPPLEAALCGVSLHARIGTVARERAGWFLAEDLVPLASEVLAREHP